MNAKSSASLSGRVALVTGGTGGIGTAICERLSAEGATVYAADISGDSNSVPAQVLHAECDVSSEASVTNVMQRINTEQGRLDILVNAAGIEIEKTVEETSVEEWNRIFAINVTGTFLTCKHGLALMREAGGGSIINISSIAGLIASDTMPGYNASKAAVWMLTKSIALHCAKKNMQIRCNSVHPTFVDTPILDGTARNHNLDKGVLMDKLARQIPLKFVGEPNDIANAVVYLASDESRFMTGAEMKLDGGISAM